MSFFQGIKNAVSGGDEESSGNSTLDGVIDGAADMLKEKMGSVISGGKDEDGESSGGIGDLVDNAAKEVAKEAAKEAVKDKIEGIFSGGKDEDEGSSGGIGGLVKGAASFF